MKQSVYRDVYVSDFANIPLWVWLRHQYCSYFIETYKNLVEIVKLDASIKEFIWFFVRIGFMPISLILIAPIAVKYRKKSSKEKYKDCVIHYYTFYGVDREYITKSKPFRWEE